MYDVSMFNVYVDAKWLFVHSDLWVTSIHCPDLPEHFTCWIPLMIFQCSKFNVHVDAKWLFVHSDVWVTRRNIAHILSREGGVGSNQLAEVTMRMMIIMVIMTMLLVNILNILIMMTHILSREGGVGSNQLTKVAKMMMTMLLVIIMVIVVNILIILSWWLTSWAGKAG